MSQTKKVSFDDLIAKKMQRDRDKVRLIDVKVTSMDKILVFTNPTDEQRLDFFDEAGDGENSHQTMAAMKKLIYRCCPILQDAKLHEALEVEDPLDVVPMVFSLADINEIGNVLGDESIPEKVDDTIKN